MGPVVSRGGRVIVTRMGFLVCMDGFPAFHVKRRGAISLMPAELINLSLPAHMRYDPDNMLVWMLIPHDMSATSQLKYFDYVVAKELNPIAKDGVTGPDGPVSIKLFGASLDLKGKEKFYNQMAVGSYCGCSTCAVHYDQGPDGPIFAVARRYLPADHPLRQQRCTFRGRMYEYRNEESRGPPKILTTQDLFNLCARRRIRNIEHLLGQKGPIMLRKYQDMEYANFNLLEWMHNCKCGFDFFLDLLVGKDPRFDTRCRRTSKKLGVFESIWEGQIIHLSKFRTRALAGLDDAQILARDATWNRRWLRMCGVQIPEGARVAELRARVAELRDQARGGQPIVLPNHLKPLPWRLTSLAHKEVDKRLLHVVYPHYTPVCHIDGASFINRAGIWRTASKLIAFTVLLVPALRGFVPKLRTGLSSLIWGLRILEGQTLSVSESDELNLERGFKVLKKTDIQKARTFIIEGLAIIEGSCPVCVIVPALHCFCHYADGAELHGLLKLYWMISFGTFILFHFHPVPLFVKPFFTDFVCDAERFNKKCKNLTANKHLPLQSLANALVRDETARFFRWKRKTKVTRNVKVPVTELTGQFKFVDVCDDMLLVIQQYLRCGCRSNHCSCYEYSMALIGGKRFNAGERLRLGSRCGSIVTMVKDGRSVYGLVKNFYRFICQCDIPLTTDFAVVTWFPFPEYPDITPLYVRIVLNGLNVNTLTELVIVPLFDIQPSRVCVEIDRENDCMIMLRMEGLDTMSS